MKQGWIQGNLSDFVEHFIVPQRDKPKEFSGLIPWCRIEDIDGVYLSESKSGKCVTEMVVRDMPLRIFPVGTVMVSCSADLGRCAIVSRPLVTNQTFIGLVPKSDLDSRFLYYLMTSRAGELNAAATGATIKYLSQEKFRRLSVLVPNLQEQQRIVRILDEAFEGIATAKANAEQNLQNARALFESHLQSVFTQKGEGWVDKRLEEIAADDCSLSYGIVQPGDDLEGGLPVVRPTDLTKDVISINGLKRIDPKRADSYQRTTLQGHELLLCVRGTTGVISMASTELVGANVTRGIVPIRFKPNLLTTRFGFHLLRSEPVQSQIRAKTYGAALMQINIGDLRQITVSFPSLDDQHPIASKLDDLAIETQRLAAIYEGKLAALDELKKSLLHQAFSGQL